MTQGYADFISSQNLAGRYKTVDENMLGFSGAQALGKSRDERHKDAAAHIDYHVRQNPDYHNASDSGDKDRMRHAAAKKLGYNV